MPELSRVRLAGTKPAIVGSREGGAFHIWARRLLHPVHTARHGVRRLLDNQAIRSIYNLFERTPTDGQERDDLVARYRAAIRWIQDNRVLGGGIRVTNKQTVSYPEVSGYFIPTLLNWGEKDLAIQFARWLVSIQNPDGSWSDAHGKAAYTFDTGQILKGLLALVDSYPEFQAPILKGCEWLLGRVEATGQVSTPDKSDWGLPGGKEIPEAIHLYALEPLQEAGKRWGKDRYCEAVRKALAFYRRDEKFDRFDTLSHFHAYIVEALIDLGCADRAMQAMAEIEKLQRKDGAVPGYRGVKWVCSTGLFQYAVIWYKLGNVERGDRAFAYACALQNRSGGFFGGYGAGATYFPGEEISWAVKYFLDALWWKIRMSFSSTVASSTFPDSIDENDGRFSLIVEEATKTRPMKILDVGCGKGRFISQLKAHFPESAAYGMDLSETMLAYLPPTVTSVLGTALNIPFADGFFDYAFCVESLEHVLNLPAAVRELARVVKTGGTLVIIDKNRQKLGQMNISEWEQWFTAEEMTQLLEREGFAVTVRSNIPYDAHDGTDGLFLGWIARKSAPTQSNE